MKRVKENNETDHEQELRIVIRFKGKELESRFNQILLDLEHFTQKCTQEESYQEFNSLLILEKVLIGYQTSIFMEMKLSLKLQAWERKLQYNLEQCRKKLILEENINPQMERGETER